MMLLTNPREKFEEIYRIYEMSFPEVERRTKEGQRAIFENPLLRVWTAEREGRTAAFLTGWNLESCLYLEHLATDPACRGGGMGKELMHEAIQAALDRQVPLILEIEPVTEEDPYTARRAAFYERYVKPLVQEGNSLGLTEEELLAMVKRAGEKGD